MLCDIVVMAILIFIGAMCVRSIYYRKKNHIGCDGCGGACSCGHVGSPELDLAEAEAKLSDRQRAILKKHKHKCCCE